MGTARHIAHVDMDAFFASIVQLDQPELRGRPVLVGSDGPRGVVCAASYEARPSGCRSAMPMSQAKRLSPDAVVAPVPGARVRELSARLFEVLGEFSPLVEPLSVDEAFVDLTGTDRLMGPPRQTAQRIRQRIFSELGLTASVGLAPNKFLAKLASDQNKPDGLTIVEPAEVLAWLAAMPIGRMWGIGRVGQQRMAKLGIHSVGDLQRADAQWMATWFGNEADRYTRLSHGVDDRPVVPEHQAKSISHEQTFSHDIEDAQVVRTVLLDQVEQVGWRLRRRALRASKVTLKIRYGQFETISRSHTMQNPTDVTDELWRVAAGVFDAWASTKFQPVRLIGMGAGGLTDQAGQIALFGQDQVKRAHEMDLALDQITEKFGDRAIRRAGGIRPDR